MSDLSNSDRSACPTKSEVWSYECPCCYASYDPDERPEDGRCAKCDDSPMLREKQSEFGAGVIVCIVKFSEHLWTNRESVVWELGWLKRGKRKEADLSTEAKHQLDFARRWWRDYPQYRNGGQDTILDDAIHKQIETWASGASDHFADLDEEHAPTSLVELGNLMFRLRNGFMDEPERRCTLEDLERVKELWQQAAMDLDRALGVVPNWGEW